MIPKAKASARSLSARKILKKKVFRQRYPVKTAWPRRRGRIRSPQDITQDHPRRFPAAVSRGNFTSSRPPGPKPFAAPFSQASRWPFRRHFEKPDSPISARLLFSSRSPNFLRPSPDAHPRGAARLWRPSNTPRVFRAGLFLIFSRQAFSPARLGRRTGPGAESLGAPPMGR